MASIATITDFDSLPIPGGIVEVDGTFVSANIAGATLLGRPVDKIIGRKVWEFAPGAEHIWPEVVASARKQGVHRGQIAIAAANRSHVIHYVVTLRQYEARSVVLVLGLEAVSED